VTLLIAAAAAVLVTVLRFSRPGASPPSRLGSLALIYWGATLMWCVDALVEGGDFFAFGDRGAMTDDSLLGLAVVVLGLGAWLIVRLARRGKPSAGSETTG
jgi:hypothetical protein